MPAISRATSLMPGSWRSETTIPRGCSVANRRASAAPIPPAAPVTTMHFPVSFM